MVTFPEGGVFLAAPRWGWDGSRSLAWLGISPGTTRPGWSCPFIVIPFMISGSSRKARHAGAIGTRREMLVKMQQRALFIIQSYWLPKFLIQCKMGIEEEKLCWPLLQEYRERVAQGSTQEPLSVSDDLFAMHITKSQDPSGPYCSKKAKEKVWALVKEGRDTQEAKTSFQAQPERQPGPAGSVKRSQPGKEVLGPGPASAAFGGKERATSPKRPRPKAELAIRLEDLCEKKVLSSLRSSTPLAKLPTPKTPAKTLRLLPWALSADSCAGRPFRDFLKCQGQTTETHLLDLWHDLEEFLPVVLDPSRENSFFLRHLIADRILKTYLEESAVQQLPLEARTLQGLREHLASGEFTPWIFRAQKEICKVQGSSGRAGRYHWSSQPGLVKGPQAWLEGEVFGKRR